MLEYTYFNGWYYGTGLESVDEYKINIGVFNPRGIQKLSARREEIDLKVFLIDASDKTRLLRQLNRENNPNVKEIIRRFNTDEEDFSRRGNDRDRCRRSCAAACRISGRRHLG